MNANIVTLDIRKEVRAGIEPFSQIMETVDGLKAGQDFRLLAPFKPLPLFDVLARKGFSHVARPLEGGEWEVIFSQNESSQLIEAISSNQPTESCGCGVLPEPVVVDARGLEPPQPLVAILEALTNVPDNATLHALTDRRPLHLYPHLTGRGFAGESEEQSDGSFITYLRRR